MAMRRREAARAAGLLLGLWALGGCVAPQYEALKRDLEVDPRQRVRVYDSCVARSRTVDDLDNCMREEGYRFLKASDQDYRAGECWNSRYAGTKPKAYCYEPVTDTVP